MYIAILGRQAALSMAELEALYGSENVEWFSDNTALVQTSSINVEALGGTPKAGLVTARFNKRNLRSASADIIKMYVDKWKNSESKITLGISAYGHNDLNPRDIQKIGITVKQNLKKSGVSVRLIPNNEASLNTATSHHNKLGLSANKVELLLVQGSDGSFIVAESTGAQNITALAKRDQARPKRDAFVGMLPPKLAQIMINLARKDLKTNNTTPRLLDAFCGTGVILQEAALMGFAVYGTDVSEKMIDYTKINLDWLKDTRHLAFQTTVDQGDAMTHIWQQPITMVVSEAYLGQPFSAPPSSQKLAEVQRNVTHILTDFLKNIYPQLQSGTPLCLAIPAWRDLHGHISRLHIETRLEQLGYKQSRLTHISPDDLIYYREDQVVARELIVFTKK